MLDGREEFDDLDVHALSRRPGIKWSRPGPDVLPAWIAETDFAPAPAVREALLRCVADDLGYPFWEQPEDNPVRAAFAGWMHRRYGWAVDPAHMREFTHVNQALQAVLQVATRPGDTVALHTPAYPPFLKTLQDMGRHLLAVPYDRDGDSWSFDPEQLADGVRRTGCRVLLLVNPHNPTGRALRPDELKGLADLVLRQDMLVVSDEIHAELVHDPHRHIPFATLGPEVAARTVTLTSASKAYNIPGVRCAVAHIGPAEVREALRSTPQLHGEPSTFGVAATVAAWRDDGAWLARLRTVLARNAARVHEGLPRGVRHVAPDATFLAWLDCRDLDLGTDPYSFFLENARVMLVDGRGFGPGGEGFVRLNFGTSAGLLDEILGRMRRAVG